MPVIQFTRDVGSKWKEGQVVNLPTSTLKSMAQTVKVDSYEKFSKVLAVGRTCVSFMAEYKKGQAVESVLARRSTATPKKAAAPRRAVKKKEKRRVKK